MPARVALARAAATGTVVRPMSPSPEVRVLANARAAVPLLLDELRAACARRRSPLIGFATGGTFRGFLKALGVELASGRMASESFVATHLDEYLAFAPERRGGMVHELVTHCPPFAAMLARGAFVPVPHDGGGASLRAHEERLRALGGIELQFVGIGRNGHLAFNEPGTSFESAFHVATLAPSTRDDARAAFAPDAPPERAATAGLATILAARRIVFCAFGRGKADAVRAMLRGAIAPACPASVLRRHGNALVLLDRDAAAQLEQAPGA
jgi:glucosamine-6-phosphate deaminase